MKAMYLEILARTRLGISSDARDALEESSIGSHHGIDFAAAVAAA